MSRPCFALSVMLSLLAASLLAIGSTSADETSCPWSHGSSSGWTGCADYSDYDYQDYDCHDENLAADVTDDDLLNEFFGADIAVTAPNTDSAAEAVVSDEELWEVFDAAEADASSAAAVADDASDSSTADIPWDSILESVEEYEFTPASESAVPTLSGCDLEATGDEAFDQAMGLSTDDSTNAVSESTTEVQQLLGPTGLVVWAAERCQSSVDQAWLQDVVARAIASAFHRPAPSQEIHPDTWTCDLAYAEQPVSEERAGVLLTTAATLDRMAGLLAVTAETLRDLAGQRLMLAKQPSNGADNVSQ